MNKDTKIINIKGFQSKILKYLFDNKYYKEELLKNIKMIIFSSWDKIINNKEEIKNIEILIRLPKDNYTDEDIKSFIDYFITYLESDDFVNNILIEDYFKNKEKIEDFLRKNLKIMNF